MVGVPATSYQCHDLTLVIWSFTPAEYKLAVHSRNAATSLTPKSEKSGIAKKTGSWLMACGGVVVFVGLCFLPAAFGENPDKTMLPAGLAVFSIGMLFAAAGFYVKAQTTSSLNAPVAAAAPVKKGRKAKCDRCGQDEPVIQCRVHQVHLCGDCLAEHYDFRSCAYVPSTRKSAAQAAGV